ncbi:NAD(P)H-dependent oxidoreductase [Sphingobacterium sp. DR205]|uniref:NAD(P)H-dependent oxidoreductase n=1 Tax=Sphingobacterium sp. DR205 TaxID=2713573 RepID=UPI0013E477B4|nr:NAD(P)H-dependent oxidoreductase [Sphingobacterium sp. DR205]QIH33418.1 NAD(P)H-dependent oxidoreductase [Sphingobacterium sp. DR205]
MNLLIISASHKLNGQSHRVAELLKDMCSDPFTNVEIQKIIDVQIPFWDEEAWALNNTKWTPILNSVRSALSKADAFIFIVPEYNGMVPPNLKNYFLIAGEMCMAHKPALIVSISAGNGGSYPIMELRSSGYKNTKICFIPENIIIRNVSSFTDDFYSDNNKLLYTRIQFCIELLKNYSECLKPIRKLELEFSKFAYGM